MNQKLYKDGNLIPHEAATFTANPYTVSTSKYQVLNPVESKSIEMFELIHTHISGPLPNSHMVVLNIFLPSLIISRVSLCGFFLNKSCILLSLVMNVFTISKANSVQRLSECVMIVVANIYQQ
jgi:hypothetical protein